MKRKYFLIIMAAFLGAFIAVMYIVPHSGEIKLSQLVMGLSGSEGGAPIEPNISGVWILTVRLLPQLLYQVFAGFEFYRFFCTASVYVFSRIPGRRGWYLRQMRSIGLETVLYQAVYVLAAILTVRFCAYIYFDTSGLLLLLWHMLLLALWNFAAVVLINILAVKLGSMLSFCAVGGLQMAFTALILMIGDLETGWISARLDPVSMLVIGWQGSRISGISSYFYPPGPGLYFEDSLLFLLAVCAIVISIGVYIVTHHDLLIADAESGGF